MGVEEKKELKDRGFIILEKMHLIVGLIIIIASLIIGGVVQAKLIQQNITNHETRISKLEQVKEENHDLLLEIKYNLKTLVEKQGGIYQQIK
jgi:amino acid transporter